MTRKGTHERTLVAPKGVRLRRPIQIPERRRESFEVVFRRLVVPGCDQSGLRQLLDAFVDFRNRVRQLLAASLMGGELHLSLHFDPRQLERFNLSRALRVGALASLARLSLFFFAFFHALGEA
jgi:hypothetical protein